MFVWLVSLFGGSPPPLRRSWVRPCWLNVLLLYVTLKGKRYKQPILTNTLFDPPPPAPVCRPCEPSYTCMLLTIWPCYIRPDKTGQRIQGARFDHILTMRTIIQRNLDMYVWLLYIYICIPTERRPTNPPHIFILVSRRVNHHTHCFVTR